MKIVQINCTSGKGSTGKICEGISAVLTENNIDNIIIYSEGSTNLTNAKRLNSDRYRKIQALKSRIFGNYGFNSNLLTKKIIKELDQFKPDIVHLHNVHGHNLNIEKFFRYVKERKIKVVWTQHDCWTFTGYCTHFSMINCEKWRENCKRCPQRKRFSWFLDRSTNIQRRKREALNGADLTVVTPSKWLAGLIKESFLKSCPVQVIYNGIDLSMFKPTDSDFREKYQLKDKYIVLGVAFGWDKTKGLDTFLKLAERFNEKYQIVLVGTDENVDKQLPKNIISIHRTQNQIELAKIYSVADVLVNPTMEDTFPTVNLEALACGTPVITYATGGSPEGIDDRSGKVVEQGNVDGLEKEIYRACEEGVYTKEDCIKRASIFEKKLKFNEYITLYRSLVEAKK